MKRVKNIFRKIMKIMNRDEIAVLPGHLAFFLVLSVVPIIALIGFIASCFSLSLDIVINELTRILPTEISDILIPYISGKGIDIHIGFSMLVIFIVASNGAHSLIISSNALYHIRNSSYLKRKLKAIFMTFLMVALFLFVVIVLAFGDRILNAIMNIGFLKNVHYLYDIFTLLKWPISYILIMLSVKILFTVAPDAKIPSKYMNKGVHFTTIGWILVTALYSYYVSNIANYDIFYGGLSNIIILMMWIYILSYILVLGIAINSNNYNMEEITSNKKEESEKDNN